MKDFNWKTNDGRIIPVSKMSTKHIENSIKYLKNRGFISQKVWNFYLTCPMPNGDFSELALNSERSSFLNKPVSNFIDIFEEELKSRAYRL